MSSIPNLFAKLLSLHVQNRFEYFGLISKGFCNRTDFENGFLENFSHIAGARDLEV